MARLPLGDIAALDQSVPRRGTTQLKADPATRLRNARQAMLKSHPFWGILATRLDIRQASAKGHYATETCATDGEILVFNPDFVQGMSDEELKTIVAHEVEHIARLDHYRRGSREAKRWNQACDERINWSLKKAGFVFPKGIQFRKEFEALSAEEIYDKLQNMEQKGNAPQPSPSLGDVIEAPEDGDGMGEFEAQQDAQEAQSQAKASGMQPDFQEGVVKLIIESSKIKQRVSWREHLRKFADESMVRDTSWCKVNRRHHDGEFILPGQDSVSMMHLVVCVDTSGSMSRDALANIGRELQAILDDQCADMMTVVYCDTSVKSTDTFFTGDVVKMDATGGGGTAFSPAFAWVAEHVPSARAIVYMTDLQCQDYGQEPECPVMWACEGEIPAQYPVPWGQVIEMRTGQAE